MKTNQLPPELVEKYEKVIDEFDDSESIFRILHLKTKCAKIAVEYADEVTVALSYSVTNLSKQRDELLEALRYIASADIPTVKFKTKTQEAMHLQQVIDNLTNKAKKSIENYECTHSSDKWCISCYESKKDEIIGVKKHEDGKE